MTFVEHARANGLIMTHAIADSRWHRVKTTDKPNKRNGAYIFDGVRGLIKNWATMDKCLRWPDDGQTWIKAAILPDNTLLRNADASKLAQQIIDRARLDRHPYLEKKGFPDVKGLIDDEELIIPMRDFRTHDVLSVQKIKPDGQKKFLPGGRAKNAVFVFNRKALKHGAWLVEGYATGLSVHHALQNAYWDVATVVCFSAGNLASVGRQLHKGWVFADNDAAGLRAAEESSLPWVTTDAGDANDLHQRDGIFAVRRVLQSVR